MALFGRFYLDKEKDIIVDLFQESDGLHYVLRTPNHNSGNLITNLAKLCDLPLEYDEQGLKVIRGVIPCYVDGSNRRMYIFRMGNTKIANIFPDGSVEMKASVPAISKALMSQTKNYRLSILKTIVKTYIFDDCKFHADLHTHMSGNLEPDILIALGIRHQVRYPLYYIKKLGLKCSMEQMARLGKKRAEAAERFTGSQLSGKYLDRKIDDNTFINFADLILNNLQDAEYNIARIRISLAVPKDGQAVFADLEKVYLYRYVFTKGVPSEDRFSLADAGTIPDKDIAALLGRMLRDAESEEYRDNTLFQDKLLWIARNYQRYGISYAEITDTSLVKKEQAAEVLRQIHAVMPAVTKETGVLLRFLAGIRRVPLTIVRDNVTQDDYLAENMQVLRAVAADPYVAGSDIVGEEINDILELKSVIRELVEIAAGTPGFVIRIHAGENDALRDNVANSITCIRESLAPGQRMPAVRIGHGLYTSNLSSPRGKKLIQDLLASNVVLEFQLTSNVRLNNLSDLSHHPLRQYLRSGIRCVQGTDGGALYGTNSIDEELALEKMLGLSHDELCQMRKAEDEIVSAGCAAFEEKLHLFESSRDKTEIKEYLEEQIRQSSKHSTVLWDAGGKRDAEQQLSGQIAPFPDGKLPVILAGGSFNSDRHITQIREGGKQLIDSLLKSADPEKIFFVIGHRLCGYEKYLVENNRNRFQIFAFVPGMLTRAEAKRLKASGISVRPAIEQNGNGLYKSIAYEIFQRRASVLLAFDGNSPAINLVQEAKNGRTKCRIYLDTHSRTLAAKGKTLQGYVQLFRNQEDILPELLEYIDNNIPAP